MRAMGEVVGIKPRFDPPKRLGKPEEPFEVFHIGHHRVWLYDRGFRWRWQARLWAWRQNRRQQPTRTYAVFDPPVTPPEPPPRRTAGGA